MPYFFVFIGGGLGSLLRFLISQWFSKTNLSLPWATFIANVSACILFAVVVALSHLKPTWSEATRFLVLAGFCGGLSTFSTFSYENYLLLKQGFYLFAAANILFTTLICLLIFYWFGR